MTAAQLFGDVEAAVVAYLEAELSETITGLVPRSTRDALPFVIVQRLGGPQITVVTEQATVALEAWASSYIAAHDLILRVRQKIHSLTGTVQSGLTFYGVQEFAGPARLPDPESGIPRYTLTVAMTVRATAP